MKLNWSIVSFSLLLSALALHPLTGKAQENEGEKKPESAEPAAAAPAAAEPAAAPSVAAESEKADPPAAAASAAPVEEAKKIEVSSPEKTDVAKAAKPDEPVPEELTNKLRFGIGLSVGIGKANLPGVGRFSSDRVGYFGDVSYDFPDVSYSQNSGADPVEKKSGYYTHFHYRTFTGLDWAPQDLDYSFQTFAVGGGKYLPFGERNEWRVQFGGFLGLGKLMGLKHNKNVYVKSVYTAVGAATAQVTYVFLEKCGVTAGATAQIGKAAWYGADLGVSASF